MVNFRQTPKPRNYLARREQWRLLLLVLSLGLVVVLMIEARDPQNWGWLFALGRAGDGSQAASASARESPIDNRLDPTPPEERIADTFISAPPAPVEAQEDTAGRYFPGVKPKCLESIRDDTSFRPQEQEAWFNLLGILKKTKESTLRRESTGRVTYAQLLRQSDEYRGELVTLRGTIRRAHCVSPGKNDCGIKEYYQTWFWPAGVNSPMVVYCLYLPKGFPTGMEMAEEAECTGFFFKRWAYMATDRLRTAPALLARTVRWDKAPPTAKKPLGSAGSVFTLIGLALAVGLFVVVFVYLRTQSARPDESGAPPEFDALRDANLPSGIGLPPGSADRQEPSE